MGGARMLAGLTLTLLLGSGLQAGEVLYRAKVIAPEAEVRSGPGADPKLYPTNRLPRDATVEVVEELQGGWLAIKPPPSSFSWINTRFLEQRDRVTWVVTGQGGPVPVRYGSELLREQPTVESVRVPPGTLVVAIGRSVAADDGVWLPIEPPERERRFVLARSVEKINGTPPAADATVVRPAPFAVPGASGMEPPRATAASPPVTADPRWVLAQQAEQRGDFAAARRLYQELGDAVRTTDTALATQCYRRVAYLAQWVPEPAAPTGVVPRQSERSVPAVTASAPTKPNDQAVAFYRPGQPAVAGTPVTPAMPAPAVAPGTSSPPSPAKWEARQGYVRVAGCCIDGKRAYALQDAQGRLLTYLTPQPGVDLEAHVNSNVQVSGSILYRADCRNNHMVAGEVSPLR